MLKRTHGTVAHRAKTAILEFWRGKRGFFEPKVEVDPLTYEITSDMKNGWPPKRSEVDA